MQPKMHRKAATKVWETLLLPVWLRQETATRDHSYSTPKVEYWAEIKLVLYLADGRSLP